MPKIAARTSFISACEIQSCTQTRDQRQIVPGSTDAYEATGGLEERPVHKRDCHPESMEPVTDYNAFDGAISKYLSLLELNCDVETSVKK